VLFMALAYVGMMIALFAAVDSLRPFLIEVTARSSALMLTLLGAGGRSEGAVVTSAYGSVVIIYECTGVFPGILLVSALMAFPSGWRPKLSGVCLALPGMLVLNQVRILSLVYLGHFDPDSMEMVHHIIWPAIIVFCTAVLFVLWARSARRVG
jgi:exosortase/archaeosortase family protein